MGLRMFIVFMLSVNTSRIRVFKLALLITKLFLTRDKQISAGVKGGFRPVPLSNLFIGIFPKTTSQITLLKQTRKEDTTNYKSGVETLEYWFCSYGHS